MGGALTINQHPSHIHCFNIVIVDFVCSPPAEVLAGREGRGVLCRTTAEFASMSMAERLDVTELTRQYWPGTIINNISAASHVDALQYLRHSQELVSECQVIIMALRNTTCTAVDGHSR